MNMEMVAVDTNTLWVYDFAKDNESAEELLARANEYKATRIKETKENLKYINENCPDNNNDSFFNKLHEDALKVNYQVMTFDEYRQMKREKYLSDDLQEITQEEWDDKLDVLPPLYWCTIDGVNEFCMREMYDDTFTTQYARYNGKYYSKMVDVTDKSTWIHNYKKEMS